MNFLSKKIIVLLFLFLPLVASAQSFPSTPILYDANTDENPVTTSIWTNGLTGTGQCGASSGVFVGTSGTDDCYITQSYGEDQEVFITYPNLGSLQADTNIILYFCVQSSGIGSANLDGYGVRIRKITAGNDVVKLVRITNTGTTDLGTGWSAGEFSNGWKIGARRETGGTFTLYMDTGSGWTQQDQVTSETVYTCANTFIGYRGQSSNSHGDDFGGGNVGSAASNQNLIMLTPMMFN